LSQELSPLPLCPLHYQALQYHFFAAYGSFSNFQAGLAQHAAAVASRHVPPILPSPLSNPNLTMEFSPPVATMIEPLNASTGTRVVSEEHFGH